MNQEIERLYNLLVLVLGESKSGYCEGQMQYQFPCPRCVDREGNREIMKYNLEVNIQKQVFQCWKCSSIDEEMHGSILKLIRLYGNSDISNEYKRILQSIRENKLYRLNFSDNDFNVDTTMLDREELKFPQSFKRFERNGTNSITALRYLENRGIGWDIINKFGIGYTTRQQENKKGSFRIIVPSYNALGELNYWVGRDYLPSNEKTQYKRLKYDNPKVEKKDIIFNENKVQWDADVTLVEGVFDHIVVPNSIPLLGKALNRDYKLYWSLVTKCNACVNVWLDDDAKDSAKRIYSLLNHGTLYNRIRLIDAIDKDPSEIYEKHGKRGIINCLRQSKMIPEYELTF